MIIKEQKKFIEIESFSNLFKITYFTKDFPYNYFYNIHYLFKTEKNLMILNGVIITFNGVRLKYQIINKDLIIANLC